MAKSNKNKSRELDVTDTPEYQAQVQRIRDGWRVDFEQFCTEKLKIVDKTATSNPIVGFEFNQCQKALTALVERIGDFQEMRTTRLNAKDPRVEIVRYPVEVVILKARKVGVSTWCEARGYWKGQLFKAQKGLVMAHERPAAQNIMDIMQRFELLWPINEYPIVKSPMKRISDDLMEWDGEVGTGSSIVVETAGSKGGGSSRSFTYHFVHMSEVGFFPQDSAQVSAALSARAVYHETYLESTANGTGNMFHDEWTNAMWIEDLEKLWAEQQPFPRWWNGKIRFFWPWFNQDENYTALEDYEREYIETTLDEEERDLIALHQLSLEQIAWRRKEIAGPCSKQTAMTPSQFFKQEHPSTPEEAFVAKSQSIFDTKKLNAMAIAARDLKPVFTGFLMHDPHDATGFKLVASGQYIVSDHGMSIIEGAQFVQWELPNPDEAYVMGIDTAEGTENGDWTVISIFSRTNGTKMREVARLRSKTPAREAGEMANFLGLMYNEAYIVAERNPPGNALVEKLVDLGYGNMFHHRNIETVTNHDNPEAFTAGFKTTVTTKPMICERGVQGIRDDEIELRHPDAIREWKMYARVDRKYGAPDGQNDDCVMADLLAYFGMSEAPAMSVQQRTAINRNPNMTGEEQQSAYWTKRIAEVRNRCAARNAREAALLLHRSKVRHYGDVLN